MICLSRRGEVKVCRLRAKPSRPRALARESSDSDCQTATPLCVIARSGSDEAIQSGISRLHCFARLLPSLAMTNQERKPRKKKAKASGAPADAVFHGPHKRVRLAPRKGGLRRLTATGALACRRSTTALAAASERRRSAPVRASWGGKVRSGCYPLPAAIQFTLLRSLARASEDLAGSPQAGRSAGRALTRSRPGVG